MARQRLKYKGLADIVGSEGMCVIMLTDEPETRCLNIICDKTMSQQLQMRTGHLDICNCLLPEVLMKFLGDYVPVKKLEINIQNILDGQYLVGLMNTDNYAIHRIRLSDAVLLHLIADVPLYIDEQLMISTPTTDKAFLKREAVRRCAKSVLAVDSGKFGNKAVIAVNRVEDYDILVTDRILTDSQREILAAGGTEVIQV